MKSVFPLELCKIHAELQSHVDRPKFLKRLALWCEIESFSWLDWIIGESLNILVNLRS